MKLTVALTLFFLSAAQLKAAEFSTTCSNSDNTIAWQSGPYANTIKLTFLTIGGPWPMNFPLSEVQISMETPVLIEDKVEENCWNRRKTHVYAGRATIIHGKNQFSTSVICSDREDTPLNCKN